MDTRELLTNRSEPTKQEGKVATQETSPGIFKTATCWGKLAQWPAELSVKLKSCNSLAEVPAAQPIDLFEEKEQLPTDTF